MNLSGPDLDSAATTYYAVRCHRQNHDFQIRPKEGSELERQIVLARGSDDKTPTIDSSHCPRCKEMATETIEEEFGPKVFAVL